MKTFKEFTQLDEEQLDELSKKTLTSYMGAARKQVAHAKGVYGLRHKGLAAGKTHSEWDPERKSSSDKRLKGIGQAYIKTLSKEEFESLDEAKASAITGTRKIASFDGDHGHTAVVRHSKEYNEYQVHHYKDGKHIGAENISYHDTKADAIENAKHEVGLNESDDHDDDEDGKVDCHVCYGTGEGRGDGSACPNCRGSGRVFKQVDPYKQKTAWTPKKK